MVVVQFNRRNLSKEQQDKLDHAAKSFEKYYNKYTEAMFECTYRIDRIKKSLANTTTSKYFFEQELTNEYGKLADIYDKLASSYDNLVAVRMRIL